MNLTVKTLDDGSRAVKEVVLYWPNGRISMTKEDHEGCWWSGVVRCSLCNLCWLGVIEMLNGEENPIVPLECPECENGVSI